jgi:hypothetical protein
MDACSHIHAVTKSTLYNAYKLELHADFGTISCTFNIADLKPYFEEDGEIEFWTTSIQEGEHDVDIPSIDTTKVPATTQIQSSCQTIYLFSIFIPCNYFSDT